MLFPHRTNATTTPVIYDVLVLGAGLAGLGAAIKLHGTDKTFLILEGQSKAGGRVNTRNLLAEDVSGGTCTDGTVTDPVNFVDSGAQWLHGKCNRLHTVAERHGLLTDEQSEEGLGAFIRDDGVVLDAYLVKKTDFLVGQILTECEKYARPSAPDTSINSRSSDNCNANTATSYPASVSSFLLEHFQPYMDSIGDVDERQQAGQLLDWHMRFQVIDNSCLTLDDVSAKSWGKYSYNGESCQAHYNFRTGFSSAVAALVGDIGAERFRFGRDIVEIRVEENGTTLCVRCADGELFRTRHVVCTFSMGSLKYGLQRQLFRPPLPTSCERAIADIGFGTINKLFLQFAEPWWGDLDGIQLVFKSDHYETDGWTRHISGFDVMRPGPEHTLLAWVGGHGARDMELLSDAQIVADCVALLAQFTGRVVPAPVRHFCTRWHTNRFVRGAYSYISTSCDRNGTDSGSLARPVTVADMRRSRRGGTEAPKTATESADYGGDDNNDGDERPLILFAGEAVHDQYFSTAHGAFLSGIEQATKIEEFYRIA